MVKSKKKGYNRMIVLAAAREYNNSGETKSSGPGEIIEDII